jgi:hypothetical protein
MSTKQRFQNALAHGLGQRLLVVAHPSLESHARQLMDDANCHHGQIHLIGTEAGNESQQLERQKQNALIEDLKDQLEQVIPAPQETGKVHHYLIDTHAVAAGDAAAQSTLKALLSASLQNAGHHVVAALPLTGPVSEGTQAAIQQSLEHYGFSVITDRTHYVNYLAAP